MIYRIKCETLKKTDYLFLHTTQTYRPERRGDEATCYKGMMCVWSML
jgi:hypothetical protein